MLNWLDQNVVFRRRSGDRLTATPLALVDRYDTNPVVAVEAGHPFVELGFQFLLRDLLQIAMPPMGPDEWAERLLSPPTQAELERSLAPYRPALIVDHPEQPFLQVSPTAERLAALKAKPVGRRRPPADAEDDDDAEELAIAGLAVVSLLPEQPTTNVLVKGDDFFTHGQRQGAIGLGLLPALLYANMTLFPSTGGGLFGMPHGADSLKFAIVGATLWESVWANVLDRTDGRVSAGPWPAPCDARVFPWLDPRLREMSLQRGDEAAKRSIGPGDRHPCAIPMPRRYRLEPAAPARCSLSGLEGPAVRSFRRWPNGLQYTAEGWWHPACAIEETFEPSGNGWAPKPAKPGKDGRMPGPRFVKAGHPLRFDDVLEAALGYEPGEPPASARTWTRTIPPPVLQAFVARRTALADQLWDRAGKPAAISRLDVPHPLSVRTLAQIFDGKVSVGTSERELPLFLLDAAPGEELPAAVADTLDSLRKMAELLRNAAVTAIKLGRTEGSTRLAADLEDALLRALDADAIGLPAGLLARWRDVARADDRMAAALEVQSALIKAGRDKALALFDDAFPLLSLDATAMKIARERRRLVRSLTKLVERYVPVSSASRAQHEPDSVVA